MNLASMHVRQHESTADTREWWKWQAARIAARLGLPLTTGSGQ